VKCKHYLQKNQDFSLKKEKVGRNFRKSVIFCTKDELYQREMTFEISSRKITSFGIASEDAGLNENAAQNRKSCAAFFCRERKSPGRYDHPVASGINQRRGRRSRGRQ